MTVRELAAKGGVEAHVIRYYTRIGLLCPTRDVRNGYKSYSSSELVRLRFIHQAQSLGFTLSEIARIFEASNRRESPCPAVRAAIQRRIEENKARLEELLGLQQRMEVALIQWAGMPDGVPTGGSVCHLIETAGNGCAPDPSLTCAQRTSSTIRMERYAKRRKIQ